MGTQAFAYSTAHSVTFMVDSMLQVLKEVIREHGMSPEKLVNSWDLLSRGMREWIQSGHLESVVIEFYAPGSGVVSARWDLDVMYVGTGVIDDMWVDKRHLLQVIAKSKKPSWGDNYDILLCCRSGRPDVEGFVSCQYRATGAMSSFAIGTVISASGYSAGGRYWR